MMWLRNRSLAGRLAMLILVGAGLVLLPVLACSHLAFRSLFVEQLHERGDTLTLSAVNRIEAHLQRAEGAVMQAAADLDLLEPEPEPVERFIRGSLERQPGLFGMAIAYAPQEAAGPDKAGGCFYYGWRSGQTVQLTRRPSPVQDLQQDWFYLPYHLRRPVWTEPYCDAHNQVMMVTFSVPVVRDGRVQAVITGDLSLQWMRQMLDDLPLGKGGLAILLSKRGYYISHPARDLEMRETVFSLAESLATAEAREAMTALGRRMISGIPGHEGYLRPLDQEPAFIHYRPVPTTGWTLGVIIPEQQIDDATARLNRINLVVGVIGTALLLAAALVVGWSVARPLHRLAEASDKLAHGDFDAPLPTVRRHDEIGRLARSFVRMRLELRKYIHELTATTAAKEKIASELAIARQIQLGIVPKLFPPFPERADLDIHATLIPAKEVGGDLYDFALLDEEHLYFAIGDVSGKGVPASLLMAVGKTLLKSTMQSVRDPARALAHVSSEIAEDNESCMFITMFCGMLNLRSGHLIYASAGHNPPLWLTAAGQARFVEGEPDAALGVLPDSQYHNRSMTLGEGDLLLLYTDGVTEAMNPAQTMFGDQRLRDLARQQGNLTSRALVEFIERAVREHAAGAEQSDDLTLLAIRRSAPAQRTQAQTPVAADPPMATLTLPGKREELPHLTAWIEQQSQALSLSPGAAMNLNLALEEWVVNVMSHAYTDAAEHSISLRLWADVQTVRIEIEDDGRPFDPTVQGEADTQSPLEHRQVGGLGIHFIRKTMDRFTYRRDGAHNIVTLVLKRDDGSTQGSASCSRP